MPKVLTILIPPTFQSFTTIFASEHESMPSSMSATTDDAFILLLHNKIQAQRKSARLRGIPGPSFEVLCVGNNCNSISGTPNWGWVWVSVGVSDTSEVKRIVDQES